MSEKSSEKGSSSESDSDLMGLSESGSDLMGLESGFVEKWEKRSQAMRAKTTELVQKALVKKRNEKIRW